MLNILNVVLVTPLVHYREFCMFLRSPRIMCSLEIICSSGSENHNRQAVADHSQALATVSNMREREKFSLMDQGNSQIVSPRECFENA